MINIPVKGFTEFLVHRHMYADGLEVIIGEGEDASSYFLQNVEAFKLWLLQVGIPERFIETFADYMWNWRLVKYDLKTHYLTIPEVQDHPLEPVAKNSSFNISKSKAEKDIFDPLTDSHSRRH